MKQKNKKAITILSIIILATLAFIWIHSCMDREDSSMESGFVYDLLCPFFELFMGKGNVTEHFIRKLAHFTEFFGLGLELMLFMRLEFLKIKPVLPVNAWVFGTFCALIDETIQLFSGRGPAVQDVWLDSAGCLTGVLIMLAGIMLADKKNKKKNGND
jgi:VanZ family protein